jgi:deoxyribodipyrimidine photo-lyase
MLIIHWFRRDLRLHDNTALFRAAADASDGVVPVFIFDDAILGHPDCGGPIVQFMLGCLQALQENLRSAGGDLLLLRGKPLEQLRRLAKSCKASAIYFNKDYEPAAVERDEEVERVLGADGIRVAAFKDQVIFEEQEILSASNGTPYTVYSPYRRSWMKLLEERFGERGSPAVLAKPLLKFPGDLGKIKTIAMPTVKSLGFASLAGIEIPAGEDAGVKMLEAFCNSPIKKYKQTRNFPAIADGTSRLSPHLRFGTSSPRQAIAAALEARKSGGHSFAEGVETWLGELIWREFYQQIIFNFPRVATGAFRENLDAFPWQKNDAWFDVWASGRTGFPIVDAGMRQLNQTGWMHNRLRMIVAMFLTKDLLIDYRLGERYFANHLIDFEIAQNNGGWQWSASTGTDAQPYFRIFNPASQSKTCDPKGEFIRRFVPELAKVPEKFIHSPHEMDEGLQQRVSCVIGRDYPPPMVQHDEARRKALEMFQKTAKKFI